ncbi:hypothetical protein NHX12_024576 [Muraenolepis orangiensis]|uniref:Tudor domain-containing protein n=1 Tax=Muraenolepis orangiensis TaxID=630683 RepID=A0A9Q0IRF6_9TELE|nr:hypothetical protein NHX12_024576 [Muraenolepis orangiensis]
MGAFFGREALSVRPVSISGVSVHPRVYLVDLQKKKLAIGSEVKASVGALLSPGGLSVHGDDRLDSLQKLRTELQTTYIPVDQRTASILYIDYGNMEAVPLARIRPLSPNIQPIPPCNWYRGLVQSVPVDQRTASILYIDYGNMEAVPLARIRPLSPNIQPIPPCATECCVAGVVLVTGIWTEECSLAAKLQLLGGRVVTLHVLGVVHSKLSTASLENFKRLSIGKDDNSEARPPEPLTQGVGDCFSVLVIQVHSPGHMICQKVDNAGVIQELQMNLRDHCSQVPVSLNFRPAPGTVCCSKFSDDNQWYRAQVLAYSSEDRVCVGYIDFGNSEEVELDRLRPLSAALLAQPMQAIPCALAGVQPIWSDECVLILQQRVCNRFLRVRVVGRCEGMNLVVMEDQASDPQADMAELLLSVGLAAPADLDQQTEVPLLEESEKSPDPLLWSSAELPCDGQTVALMVSAVQNPGQFFCCNYEPQGLQRLIDLGSELKRLCEGDSSPCQATAGQPCCALFPSDKCWYRALVQEMTQDKVLVYFVDYGNTAEVQKSDLRNITAPLLTLPFQAIPCVEPLGPEWTGEAPLWFRTALDGQALRPGRARLRRGAAGVLQRRMRRLRVDRRNLAGPPAQRRALTAWSRWGPPASEPGYAAVRPLGSPSCHTGAPALAHPISPLSHRSPRCHTRSAPLSHPICPAVTPDLPASHPISPLSHPISPAVTPDLPRCHTRSPPLSHPISPAVTPDLPRCHTRSPPLSHPAHARRFNRPQRTGRQRHRDQGGDDQEPPEGGACEAHANSMGGACEAHANSMGGACEAHANSMGGACEAHANSMGGACEAHANSMGGACEAHANSMGGACEAHANTDKTWYRAVVLDLAEMEASVLFMDYGNSETVPYSSLLPIPDHLLQPPFQIPRCSLTGRERFPPALAADVLTLFGVVLTAGVTATVHTFDGIGNQLSVTLPSEMGGGRLDDFILSKLEATWTGDGPKNYDQQQAAAQEGSSNPPATATAAGGGPGPRQATPTGPTAAVSLQGGSRDFGLLLS